MCLNLVMHGGVCCSISLWHSKNAQIDINTNSPTETAGRLLGNKNNFSQIRGFFESSWLQYKTTTLTIELMFFLSVHQKWKVTK